MEAAGESIELIAWLGRLNFWAEGSLHRMRLQRAFLSADECFVSKYANEFGQGYFLEHGTQTTNLASISKTKIVGLPVPLPPIAEQRRIIEKLDVLTARHFRARAELGRVSALAHRNRIALMRAGVRGELTTGLRATANLEPVSALLERVPPLQ